MNRYQKRLHKEIKEAMIYGYGYRNTRTVLRARAKYNFLTPCENCINSRCERVLSRIAYCKFNI